MKIIIAGAGDIGFHLAELMAYENQEITLIDTDESVLEQASARLDVLTIRGDASSISVLQNANVHRAKLLIAATTSEKTNLITSILAKKMGVKQTIARVENPEYLNEENRKYFAELGVDHVISPRHLAAKEVFRLLKQTSFTDMFEFEDGKINVIGTTLDDNSQFVNLTIGEISDIYNNISFRPFALLRGDQTLIPNSSTILRRNDHIYLMVKKEEIDYISELIQKEKVEVKNVMIVGGSPLVLKTAKKLENTYRVTIICADTDACKRMVEELDHVLVIQGDPNNVDILREEGLEQTDAFLALTDNSETNIISSLLAEQNGVYKTIALVDNIDYTHISQNIGIDTLINEKIIAANNIFRFIRKGKIEAIATLHGVDAELIEFNVHRNNQLVRKPLKNIPFPSGSRIAAVIRGDESLLPTGEFKLQLDDKVIVFAQPKCISSIENLFN